jgi:hypothetical protein
MAQSIRQRATYNGNSEFHEQTALALTQRVPLLCPSGRIENAEALVSKKSISALCAVLAGAVLSTGIHAGTDKPYVVEWVYKVKWGHADEFFDIFRKYQIPILDRQKQLGYVVQYAVYRPSLHTGEDERWDYKVVITYRDQQASTHESEVEHQLFPDHAALKRDENHRWEFVESHWDLPIHEIDPHSADE